MENKQTVYTVSSVNQYIKNMFVREYALSVIFVKGEISNCKYHSSGHIYFTLKDKASQITCVMFAGQRGGLSFRMEDGQEVIVGGSISVYERDGKYQLYAKKIVLAGGGDLYEKYEQLKKKLAKEGMFDEDLKRPIPAYAKRIGIVTAATGAAIQDIVNISRRRNPYVQLILYPAKVQGEGAGDTIVAGIAALEEQNVDVIIVGRGGGSIEDLWAFNEENVARAIYECIVPVISAVGHETDVTIADYVADLRAPTPSAAAELAVCDVYAILDQLSEARERLGQALRQKLVFLRQQLMYDQSRLQYLSPQNQIMQKRQFIFDAEEKLERYMERNMERSKHQFLLLAQKLQSLSPIRRLETGYGYVDKADGTIIDSVKKVKVGENVRITLVDGSIEACAETIQKKENAYGSGEE